MHRQLGVEEAVESITQTARRLSGANRLDN
jgi:hypothetical protein